MRTDDHAHEDEANERVAIPIDGTLDLHTFSPKDIKYLIPDYIQECQDRGIHHVRIIHGKGTGALRRSVHAILKRMPKIKHFVLADETGGSWGATLVTLEEERRPEKVSQGHLEQPGS